MEERDVGRLAAFADGIIVVAMTLLVLDIRLPRPAGGLDDAALWELLKQVVPQYFGYVLSFLVIGMFWMSHVRKFRRFTRIDGGTIWLTMFFLLTIGVVPFVTSVLSQNPGRLGTQIYAATMTLASLLLLLLEWHAGRKGLLDPNLSTAQRRYSQLSSAASITGFGASIAVAQFNPDLAKLLWMALIPVSIWMNRTFRRMGARTK